MKHLVSAFVITFILIGCATAPTVEQLNRMSDDQVMRTLVYHKNVNVLREAFSRNLITSDEFNLIVDRKIRVGMSEKALIASWGYPSKVNRSVDRYGVHKQYVYGSYSKYSSPTYVYVENDEVTGWQD